MSNWKVSKEKIEIFTHPNADALLIGKVGSYQVVVQKGLYNDFKMEEKYQIGYDYRSGAKYKEVEKDRLDNFKLAKEELKREKKNAKKEDTSV